jgi:CRISPR system Cascade subunit CasB
MEKQEITKEAYFVNSVFLAKANNGLKAKLKRADIPSMAYQSWEFLLSHRINLEYEDERQSAALIAAAIAKSDAAGNGTLSLGQALADAFKGDTNNVEEDSPASQRLRRLIACSSVEELLQVLRPILQLIDGRLPGNHLDYSRLLRQLWNFHWENQQERIKIEWTREFYGRKGKTL